MKRTAPGSAPARALRASLGEVAAARAALLDGAADTAPAGSPVWRETLARLSGHAHLV